MCRCILHEVSADIEGRFAESGVSVVVPPRFHMVFQPPYSPFLQPCEYAFSTLRRLMGDAAHSSNQSFREWIITQFEGSRTGPFTASQVSDRRIHA